MTPEPTPVDSVAAGEAMERLSHALYMFSGSVNELGLLTNEVAHQRYEAVVSAHRTLDDAIAALTDTGEPKEFGADPAFVASPSSPAVSTEGFNRGERCERCGGPAWVRYEGSIMPGHGVPCFCDESAE